MQLNSLQLAQLVAEYEAGVTVYQLAAQFGIDRRTVALHLHRQGIQFRLQSPSNNEIEEMVRLYRSGLALVAVGRRTGFASETVRRYLRERGTRMRDTHGR